ncbi:MAG: MCE family protein [Acidobacteriota bacterium]|nr:MCE family protein [Acidobacteriota bacterium]
MPSRKEIQWSQLRVGALVLAGIGILIALIFLMSGATGGPFSKKLILRSYFANAAGLKNGAPVTLEGVTVGNVVRIRVVPDRNPKPVEVTMRIGMEWAYDIHTDSTTSIAQAGVLGDSYVDISSVNATGPKPKQDGELLATGSPSIQDVIRTSESSIQDVSTLMRKIGVLVDTLNSSRGTIGALINDKTFYHKVSRITDNLAEITTAINQGKGSLGKLVNDDSLYNHANSAIAHIDNVAGTMDSGNGSIGRLIKDDTFYKNLNESVANINQLTASINQGQGAMGKLAKDPAFAKKLDDTVTRLDSILSSIDDGKGTIGQLMKNRSLYDNTNETMTQSSQLIKAIRENPKKYFVIRLKLF